MNEIRWPDLIEYAKEVAANSVAPRETATRASVRKVSREARSGLFGWKRETVVDEVVEQVTEPVDYWVLMQRYWNCEEKSSRGDEETYTAIKYCLRTNGQLVVRTEISEYATWKDSGHGPRLSIDERPFTPEDAYLFDYAAGSHYTVGSNPSVWGDDRRSDQLLVHFKGLGLSMALSNLLNAG